MTMYITDFLPLMLVVIYQNLISLLFLYSTEVIKDNGGIFSCLISGPQNQLSF